MSKIKMSFSLILAIFLVGILSTAAFAASAYSLSVKPDGKSGFNATFKRIASTETSFTVSTYTKDPNSNQFNVPGKDYPVTVADNNTVTVNIPSSDVQVGTIYKVVLNNASGEVSIRFAVLTSPANIKMASDPSDLVDLGGTGLVNANHTGADVSKKPGQKTHGFYQNNTNSCASCHQTHTAANGEYLLFKNGTYSTCSACHDGTTGAYNSFSPATASTTASISGTFNVQAANHNGSLHVADGSLKISAAPGGNSDSKSQQYGQEFDCASCHAPHGAGSASGNNLNTDPMGWGSVPYAGEAGKQITYTKGHGQATITSTIDNKNGKLFTFGASDIISINSAADLPTKESFPYILVKTKAPATAAEVAKNFWWSRAGVQPNDQVIQTYRWDNSKYVPDYSLWSRELGYPFVANTVLKDSADKDLTNDANLKVIWRDGFAFGSSVANIDHAVVSIGIDVETTGNTNIATLYDSSAPGYIPDSGTEMSKYCTSCHVDYLSTTRTDNTGVYSTAHRHATSSDMLTCVRCHYAHGSEAQIMHDANDNSYYTLTAKGAIFDTNTLDPKVNADNDAKAINYLVDPNPSSALKRYTGMSACYACHGQGAQFLNSGNNTSNKKDTTTGEFLKGGQPGQSAPRLDLNK